MDARGGSGAAERDDVFDLGEGQADPPRLSDEREYAQDIGRVTTIAGRCALARRQDAPRLVQPECLPANPAARCHFADE